MSKKKLQGAGYDACLLGSDFSSCCHSDHTESVVKHWPAWVILQVGIWRHSKEIQCKASNCRCRIAKQKIVLCASFLDSSAPESLPGSPRNRQDNGICLPLHQVFHGLQRNATTLPKYGAVVLPFGCCFHESLRIVIPKYGPVVLPFGCCFP